MKTIDEKLDLVQYEKDINKNIKDMQKLTIIFVIIMIFVVIVVGQPTLVCE